MISILNKQNLKRTVEFKKNSIDERYLYKIMLKLKTTDGNQQIFDEDFENETKMVLEKFELMEEKFENELEVVENRLDKKIKTINVLEKKVFDITKEIDVEFKAIDLKLKTLGGHDIVK